MSKCHYSSTPPWGRNYGPASEAFFREPKQAAHEGPKHRESEAQRAARFHDAVCTREIRNRGICKPRRMAGISGNASQWSRRLIPWRCWSSQRVVSRVWCAFALQPQRSQTLKLSRAPLFVERARQIVGLYLSPPDQALWLCVDEKAQNPILLSVSAQVTTNSSPGGAPFGRLCFRRCFTFHFFSY
jgi:hypothetical protein